MTVYSESCQALVFEQREGDSHRPFELAELVVFSSPEAFRVLKWCCNNKSISASL